jgi:RND family efflux transporter MFP subunit
MLRKIVNSTRSITGRFAGSSALVLAVLLAFSCSGNTEQSPAAVSMEQLYAENGQPVSTRSLALEDFSVYLKYPTVIHASSESTAYSGLNDIVRTISAEVGDLVRQDEVIISFSPDNQSLLQAALAYENAGNVFARTEALFRNNDISRQDFDAARMRYETAKAAFKAANDTVYVKAPITGTITQINVRATENVRPGTPLFTVTSQSGFETRFYVGIDEIGRITRGARVYIDNPAQNIEGRVTQVSLIMDSQKQAFPVTAFFASPEGQGEGSPLTAGTLVSGMGVDIAVETYHNEKAIVLSRRELLQTAGTYTAFVADGERPRQVAVQVGQERGLSFEITGGLYEGDMLICDGLDRLSTDTKINVMPLLALANGR